MVKNIAAVAVGVALLIDVVLFLGIGFGTGALSVSAVGPTGSADYTVTQYNVGSSWGDGLSWEVVMSNVASSGQAPITAMLAGYQSTQVDFSVIAHSTGDCGNTGRPTYISGTGADYGYYAIQYLVGGSPQPFTAVLNGNPVTSAGSSQTVYLSENISSVDQYCNVSLGGTDIETSGLAAGLTIAVPSGLSSNTFSLSGIYTPGTLSIAYNGAFTYCDGSAYFTSPSPVCQDAAATNTLISVLSASAVASFTTSASTAVLSAAASVQVLDQGTLYNGGTLSVGVTTGYDGPNGYQLEVLCPQPRSCGGQPDPAFASVNVPNDIVAQKVYTWSIPSSYAERSSTPLINNIVVVLLANYGVAAQSLSFPVTISPSLNPSAPVITASTSAGGIYPSVGSSVTLTIFANSTNRSGGISNISVEVFYLLPSQTPSSPPACGSFWITGCPYGQVVSLKTSGGNAVGTYTFSVQPPASAVAIGAEATSYAGPGSANSSAPFFLQIKPAGCELGTSCDPTQAASSLWSTVGPWLLAGALILASVFLVLIVPKFPIWARVALPAVVTGTVVLLLLLGWIQPAFAPGGVL